MKNISLIGIVLLVFFVQIISAQEHTNKLEKLSNYIGVWRPPFDHPMLEKDSKMKDLKVIDFEWGTDRKVIHSKTGFYSATKNEIMSEGLITYNPTTDKIVWIEYQIDGSMLFEGEYQLLDNQKVRRVYKVYYPIGDTTIPYPEKEGWVRTFRETFTPKSKNAIDWNTEILIDGKWVKRGWDYFVAVRETEKILITSNSEEAISQYRKARVFENKLETDSAEELYLKALQLDSTFAMAHFRLAMLRDNYEYRREKLKVALQYSDYISEGEKLLIKGRVDFYQAGYDGSNEYDYFKQLAELYPDDDEANYMFGYVHIHHGRKLPDSAIHYYKKALKLNPNVSNYYNELAYAYMENQDFDNAEKTIQDYINFLPNHENPRDTYAEMLMRDHRYEASIMAYDEVLKINRKAPWAYMGKAANLSFLKRYNESHKVIDSLQHIPLSDYEYRHQLRSRICSYIVEGNLEAAIKVLNQQKTESATGKNTREPLFHQYMALSRMTRLYFENNQPENGLKSYQDWIDFVNNNALRESAKNNVLKLKTYYQTFAYFLKGNHDLAMSTLDNKQDLSEEETLLKARILLSKNDIEKAVEVLETLSSTNPYHLLWLYKAYQRLGNTQKEQELILKLKSLIEMNNIDYALAISKLY